MSGTNPKNDGRTPMDPTAKHRVPGGLCHSCRTPMTGAAGHANRPVPNDCAICIVCCAVNIYADELTLREPTPAERAEIEASPEIQAMIQTLEAVHERERWK